MKRNVLFPLLCIAATCSLAACGNSDNGTNIATSVTPITSVSSVTASPVYYKKVSTITVTGQDLDKGITPHVIGCSNLTELPNGTATSRSYSCVPYFGTAINVSINDTATGALLKQVSVPVPLPQITMVTSMGTIVMELRPDKAKPTVDNFLQYVNDGFYSDMVFHRIDKDFVVQGGGYANGQTTLKPTRSPIVLETTAATGLSNILGTLAMARTTVLNSATSQFFFNTVDNTSLDTTAGGYAVFGSVIQGMNVVKAIEAVAVDANDWPTTPVIITAVSQTDPITVTTPAAPAGVVATGGTNKVTLAWDADPTAAFFRVYSSNGSTPAKTKVFPPVALTSLAANTTHTYTVTAVNRAGESPRSAEVSATTLP